MNERIKELSKQAWAWAKQQEYKDPAQEFSDILEQKFAELARADEAMPFPVAKLAQAALREALAEQPAQQEPVTLEAVYEVIIHWDEGGGKRSRRELSRRIVALYTSPPANKPLTGEQEHEVIGTAGVDLLELAKLWSDNKIHVYQFDNEARKIIKGVLHRARGIKENT